MLFKTDIFYRSNKEVVVTASAANDIAISVANRNANIAFSALKNIICGDKTL